METKNNLLFTSISELEILLKQLKEMETKLELIRGAKNQSEMLEMISELAIEISLTDNRLLNISKDWVNYGTWRSKCFANEFYFGNELAKALMSQLSKRITHDEELNFHIGDFIDEIEEAIYEVL